MMMFALLMDQRFQEDKQTTGNDILYYITVELGHVVMENDGGSVSLCGSATTDYQGQVK